MVTFSHCDVKVVDDVRSSFLVSSIAGLRLNMDSRWAAQPGTISVWYCPKLTRNLCRIDLKLFTADWRLRCFNIEFARSKCRTQSGIEQ